MADASMELEETQQSRLLSIEEKWKIIFNQKIRAPLYSVPHYISRLHRLLDDGSVNPDGGSGGISRRRNSSCRFDPDVNGSVGSPVKRWGSSASGSPSDAMIHPLSYVLRKLKLDLQMSYDSFVEEFVHDSMGGLSLLLAVLRLLQEGNQATRAIDKLGFDEHKRALCDEYDCLLCIKYALKLQTSLTKLLSHRNSLETIALCILSSYSKVRIAALEILTISLSAPTAYEPVLDAMTHLRLTLGESTRFKFLVSMLNSQGAVYLLFQVVCLRFFNTLLSRAKDPNQRVFLQQELALAGLDIMLLKHTSSGAGVAYDELGKEISHWSRSYIDVTTWQEELQVQHSQCSELQKQIDNLTHQIKIQEEDKGQIQRRVDLLMSKCSSFRDENLALHKINEQMRTERKSNPGLFLDARPRHQEPHSMESNQYLSVINTDQPINVSMPLAYRDSSTQPEDVTLIVSPYKPPPPLAPALPEKLSVIRHASFPLPPTSSLPRLHWSTLPTLEGTLFEEFSDSDVYVEINLQAFKDRFSLEHRVESDESRLRRERAIALNESKVQILGPERTRNILLVIRRIHISGEDVTRAISACDVSTFAEDNAQLLLTCLPTAEERKNLRLYKGAYDQLAEADQLLFHLCRIENCEQKLRIMSFICDFQNTTTRVSQSIQKIEAACTTLMACWKIKKLFQIILAIGNYMNFTRRGIVSGFRLSSLQQLSEVHSADWNETLMEYIAGIISEQFPSVTDWYAEVSTDVPKTASLIALASENENIHIELQRVSDELEGNRPTGNTDLQTFYSDALSIGAKLKDDFSRTERIYQTTCSYFGEIPSSTEPGEFFQHFARFASAYRIALNRGSRHELDRRHYLPGVSPYLHIQDKPWHATHDAVTEEFKSKYARHSPDGGVYAETLQPPINAHDSGNDSPGPSCRENWEQSDRNVEEHHIHGNDKTMASSGIYEAYSMNELDDAAYPVDIHNGNSMRFQRSFHNESDCVPLPSETHLNINDKAVTCKVGDQTQTSSILEQSQCERHKSRTIGLVHPRLSLHNGDDDRAGASMTTEHTATLGLDNSRRQKQLEENVISTKVNNNAESARHGLSEKHKDCERNRYQTYYSDAEMDSLTVYPGSFQEDSDDLESWSFIANTTALQCEPTVSKSFNYSKIANQFAEFDRNSLSGNMGHRTATEDDEFWDFEVRNSAKVNHINVADAPSGSNNLHVHSATEKHDIPTFNMNYNAAENEDSSINQRVPKERGIGYVANGIQFFNDKDNADRSDFVVHRNGNNRYTTLERRYSSEGELRNRSSTNRYISRINVRSMTDSLVRLRGQWKQQHGDDYHNTNIYVASGIDRQSSPDTVHASACATPEWPHWSYLSRGNLPQATKIKYAKESNNTYWPQHNQNYSFVNHESRLQADLERDVGSSTYASGRNNPGVTLQPVRVVMPYKQTPAPDYNRSTYTQKSYHRRQMEPSNGDQHVDPLPPEYTGRQRVPQYVTRVDTMSPYTSTEGHYQSDLSLYVNRNRTPLPHRYVALPKPVSFVHI